jgi:membrane protein
MEKTPELKGLDLKEGRGRKAVWPSEIPFKGWLDVLLRFWKSFLDDQISLVAAGVAYYTLLAIFPGIVLFVTIYGLVSDPAKAADDARALADALPPLAAEFLYKEMGRVAAAGSGGLSLVGFLSLFLALFGAGRAVKSMFQALNVAYGEREKRNLLIINLLGLAFTLAGLVAMVFVLVLVLGLPAIVSSLELGLKAEAAINYVRWPVLFLGFVFACSILYRYGPSRSAPQFRWVSHGAVVAALLWLLASFGISYWASNITDYSGTYGAFGAIILLQTWLWLTSLMILIGAKLNAETEHQTAQDSTTGRPKPMGKRGARVADELGRTRDEGADPVHEDLSKA